MIDNYFRYWSRNAMHGGDSNNVRTQSVDAAQKNLDCFAELFVQQLRNGFDKEMFSTAHSETRVRHPASQCDKGLNIIP